MPTQAQEKNGLHPFICQDTGIELKIRHVPFTVTDRFFAQYEKDHPMPEPPYTYVDYGEDQGGKAEKLKEPNLADPVYVERLRRYEQERVRWCDEQAKRLFTNLAIECTIDAEAVARLRAQMQALGTELDPDEKYVYIWNIAIGTVQGHNELMAAIQKRIQPTQEAVDQARKSFRGEVPRP